MLRRHKKLKHTGRLEPADTDAVGRQPIVFVGGIHGVGKTTVSRALAALLPALHVTAGTLIRESACAAERVTVGIGNKTVPNVAANQALLLHGLALYRSRVAAHPVPVLLDGHFALLDEAGDVVSIPQQVFVEIAPIAVLLVEATARIVRDRLLQRDTEAPSIARISELAERERASAADVCLDLRIPLWTVSGDVPTEQAASTAAEHLRPLFDGEA
jgi:adenylate kinase